MGLNRVEPDPQDKKNGLSWVGPSGLQVGAGRVGPQGQRGVSGAGRAGRVHLAATPFWLSKNTCWNFFVKPWLLQQPPATKPLISVASLRGQKFSLE